MRRFLSSLGRRLIFTHMLVAAIALLIVVALLLAAVVPIQRELVYRRLADSMTLGVIWTRAVTRLEAGGALRAATLLSRQRLLAILREQATVQAVRILVVDGAQHKVLFDTSDTLQGATWTAALQAENPPLRRFFPLQRYRAAAPNNIARGMLRLDKQRWLYMATPLLPAGSPDALFLVAMQPQPTLPKAIEPLLAFWAFVSLLVLLLIVALLSVWISRTVARNLQPVIRGTQAIAGGDLSYRIPAAASSLDEVVAVAESFNRMAEQVQQSRQAQRDFVANVGHDLKTPLTSIQGFAQALEDGAAADPAAKVRAASIIRSESQRLGKLVEELLELARLDGNALRLKCQPLDIDEELAHLIDSYAERSRAANVQLRFQPAAAGLKLTADRERLRRVFSNLLDNALTHTPPGGAVTVSTQRVAGDANQTAWLEVTVTDTGKGIPAGDLPHLFERFYQVDKARSGRRGSGLGLSIVQEIVEAHGGKVGVESVPGLGSRFWVRLPTSSRQVHS